MKFIRTAIYEVTPITVGDYLKELEAECKSCEFMEDQYDDLCFATPNNVYWLQSLNPRKRIYRVDSVSETTVVDRATVAHSVAPGGDRE